MSKKNKAYIIGISGKTTASLAKMFVDMGWEVEGSDQNCYPPASDFLDNLSIKYRTPYAAENLKGKPDLVVIGGNALIVEKQNPEYLKAKEFGLEIVSYPEVLKRFIIKKNSIVVAGTYAKTTITALLAHILDVAGLNPSFMVGGTPLNFETGIRRTESDYSVVEGDEHPTLNFDMRPKFVHYSPNIVVLTAAKWDHINIYKTEESYIREYEKLVGKIPKDGVLVACLDGEHVERVIKSANCQVLTYSLSKRADFVAQDISYDEDFTRFTISGKSFESPLIGDHNIQNVLGAFVVADYLGVSSDDFEKGLRSFKGINRHMEIREIVNGVIVMDDIAQTLVKVQETLKALRTRYKKNKIKVVFDPHYSPLLEQKSLEWYGGVFDPADQVYIAKMPRTKGTMSDKRVLGPDIVAAISQTQPNAEYVPMDEKLISKLSECQEDDVIVFLSSGGLRGMIDKTIASLKS